jgi:hypothetical protein
MAGWLLSGSTVERPELADHLTPHVVTGADPEMFLRG